MILGTVASDKKNDLHLFKPGEKSSKALKDVMGFHVNDK